MKAGLTGWAWRKMPARMRRLLVRLTQPSFTVSVGAVIFDSEGRVLLLNHVLRPASGWGIGGGFIAPNEQPEDALRRELREETGIEIENLALIHVKTIKSHVEILFRAEADSDQELRLKKNEIIEARWFFPSEVPAELLTDQRRMIELAHEIGEKKRN